MDITKQYSRHNDENNNRYYNNEKSANTNSNKNIGKSKDIRHNTDDISKDKSPIHPLWKQNNQKILEKGWGKIKIYLFKIILQKLVQILVKS